MMSRWLFTVLAWFALLLAGCAGQPGSFHLSAAPDRQDGAWPVWPKGQQVPRFVYVGELTGEQNYAVTDGGASTRGLLAWLVGLGREVRQPLVLQRPQGVAEGPDGKVWVSDVSRRAVFLFDPNGSALQVFDGFGELRAFKSPVGVAPLPDGGAWVSDAELGLLVNLSAEGQTRAVWGESSLTRPTGLAFDPRSGRLYVADTRENLIKVFNASGELVDSFGGAGSGSGLLNAPTYIALSDGHLYVTDTLNARVQVFDSGGRFVRSFGERGLYIGNLTRPKGIAVSADGLVYVVESYYDHLLVFGVGGELLLPIGGSGSRPGQFYLPSGVWAGDGGRVYVADMFNGRIAVLQFLGDAL